MPLELVHAQPGVEEAARILSHGIEYRMWISFFANCTIEYEGRAASRTTPGDRLVIIKPDGSVIVHGPRGFKPDNWQPDTSSITVQHSEGLLIVKAVRRRPREVLVIKCGSIHSIMILKSPEEGGFWMYLNEHEIRDLLASNPSLIEEGLRIVDVEKRIDPGFVDLYGIDREGRLVVIEIKRVKAGEEAAKQLARYIEYFRRGGRSVRGILVAPEATEAAIYRLSREGLEFRRIDLARLYGMLKEQAKSSRGILRYLD